MNDETPQGRFINSVSQSADRIAPAHGLYTSVMLAQAILETGYGTESYLAQHANNFFGMKFKDGEDEGKYGYIWHISNEVMMVSLSLSIQNFGSISPLTNPS